MTGNTTYYRPIQYLGSKTRVIDAIVSECEKLYVPGEYVIDMFSGSSIVSQSFYKKGMYTIANDVLAFSSDIAACMLNIYRKEKSTDNVNAFVHSIGLQTIPSDYYLVFIPFIEQEQCLLTEHNINGLKELYHNLSQVGKSNKPTTQVEYIRNHTGCSAINNIPLFANYYAGTYFGIKQALDIDYLRNKIEQEIIYNGDLWEKNLLLTALYNTCSIIVNSAGKHFAQPISIDNAEETKITTVRFFENRANNVIEVFKTCVENILSSTSDNIYDDKSFVLNMDICNSDFRKSIENENVSVIYADPPYTAQQYSRFYHILEVLHSYNYPKLQIFRGKYTQGIYPNDKYKSPFCSRVQASKAFESIFSIAQGHRSNLMVSYSESKSKHTGNERMLSLENILQLAEVFLPNYTVDQVDFDFEYKQLNSKDKIVDVKEDKEILLIFKKQ